MLVPHALSQYDVGGEEMDWFLLLTRPNQYSNVNRSNDGSAAS